MSDETKLNVRGFASEASEAVQTMSIRPFVAESDGINKLVNLWPHKPYSYCPGAQMSGQTSYVAKAIGEAAEKGAETFTAAADGRPLALLQLEHLQWDTEMLGYSVARFSWWLSEDSAQGLRCRRDLLVHALNKAREHGVRYLIARVPFDDMPGITLLQEQGFRLIDGLLTFGAVPHPEATNRPEENGSVHCSPFDSSDLPALRKLAASSFTIDRFHSDPFIPKDKADDIHRRWIENSCAGFADCVLVARDRELIGFTTLKIDREAQTHLGTAVGIIVLVATSSSHRRKGVARILTRESIKWFRNTGCRWVEVGTQVANIRASRVYQSAGFKLLSSSVTFRKLL